MITVFLRTCTEGQEEAAGEREMVGTLYEVLLHFFSPQSKEAIVIGWEVQVREEVVITLKRTGYPSTRIRFSGDTEDMVALRKAVECWDEHRPKPNRDTSEPCQNHADHLPIIVTMAREYSNDMEMVARKKALCVGLSITDDVVTLSNEDFMVFLEMWQEEPSITPQDLGFSISLTA